MTKEEFKQITNEYGFRLHHIPGYSYAMADVSFNDLAEKEIAIAYYSNITEQSCIYRNKITDENITTAHGLSKGLEIVWNDKILRDFYAHTKELLSKSRKMVRNKKIMEL